MWKFKASKFKNAVPKVPKKEEWISEISAANLLHSCGNHIRASAVYMAFNTDTGGGGDLGILPLTTRGRQAVGTIPVIRAHSEYVTDFAFSPFDDYSLATTSQDSTVKLWQLPENNDIEWSMVSPTMSLCISEKRVETVTWHPTAAHLLLASAADKLTLINTETQTKISDIDGHNELIQSCSWRGDGSVLVTSSKDKKLRIIDPRANSTVLECGGHSNMRDSRVVWLGNKDLILSSGFDMMRAREVCLRDCRNLSSSLCSKSFDTSSGVLMPLYDADTGMLFLAGKGDTSLRYLEVTDKDIIENSMEGVEQIKGLGMVPKRAMDVMSCEADRLLLLAQHTIIPIPYHIPRKSVVEFHEDLFPETSCGAPALTAQMWLDGQNDQVSNMSLNPERKPNLIVNGSQSPVPSSGQKPTMSQPDKSPQSKVTAKQTSVESPKPTLATPADPEPAKPAVVMRENKPIFSGVRQSKFRHLEGIALHKSNNIENIRNLCKTIPGESDMFQVNSKYCAIPLGGSGGLITILKNNEPGRLPDTGIPAIQNGSLVGDFEFDPFDDQTLAIACDDAKIRLWNIPEDGLTETLTVPEVYLHGHTEKIYFVRYHPLASGVLASASYDMTVRIWDLETCTEQIQLQGHTDTILCLSWSPDGSRCATVCKDGQIRIYDPRKSMQPIKTGPVPAHIRGARIVWACEGKLLLVVGFEMSSERSVRVYSVDDVTLLHKADLDMSPAILIPHYDEDSSTLFLTGRGESMVKTFEVIEEAPYMFPLTAHKTDGLHQAIAFLPKSLCDVTKVQFARALRLTTTSVEPIAYSVPRIKTEYFQDDIYPDTRVTWEAALTGSEWFSGVNKQQRLISMRPENMKLLSEAPVEAPKPKKYESFNPEVYKTDDQKKDELLNAMLGKFELNEGPLPQDLTEGVDEDEWDD